MDKSPSSRYIDFMGRYKASSLLFMKLHNQQEGRCRYCKRRFKTENPRVVLRKTTEHLVPVARGGARSDPENIALTCMACNSIKSLLTDAEFMHYKDDPIMLARARVHMNLLYRDHANIAKTLGIDVPPLIGIDLVANPPPEQSRRARRLTQMSRRIAAHFVRSDVVKERLNPDLY